MPADEMDDFLALVQPAAAGQASANPPAKQSKAGGSSRAPPSSLESVDLSALTASDLALLGPLMKLLDLSPEDVAALASQEDGDDNDDGDENDDSFEDDDDDDAEQADAALLAELAKLEEAEQAAGSLEGNLDRLLARIEGLEGEIEEPPKAADATTIGKEATK
jgi:hypothetical protein